jgi:hypothetical protein
MSDESVNSIPDWLAMCGFCVDRGLHDTKLNEKKSNSHNLFISVKLNFPFLIV